MLLAAWLAGCALTPPAPLPEGAREVWAFDVETYLGNRFAFYGRDPDACRSRREAERALERSPRPERGPFQRAVVISRCYAAALTEGGYAWGVETDGGWGAVLPTGAFCDAMRESLTALEAAAHVGLCRAVALTPRRPRPMLP